LASSAARDATSGDAGWPPLLTSAAYRSIDCTGRSTSRDSSRYTAATSSTSASTTVPAIRSRIARRSFSTKRVVTRSCAAPMVVPPKSIAVS
jgi:hypothetical protein